MWSLELFLSDVIQQVAEYMASVQEAAPQKIVFQCYKESFSRSKPIHSGPTLPVTEKSSLVPHHIQFGGERKSYAALPYPKTSSAMKSGPFKKRGTRGGHNVSCIAIPFPAPFWGSPRQDNGSGGWLLVQSNRRLGAPI